MAGQRRTLRHDLYRVAAEQSGYFTAAQALKVGYSYQAQKYHVDHSNWDRVGRGIYRIPEWPVGLHDELARWVLWSKQRAVVSHDSAAAAYGLGVANPAQTHLTVPPGFRMHNEHVLLHLKRLPKADVTALDGVPITSVLRTVLDFAETTIDEEAVESVVSDALDMGATTERQVTRRLDELSNAAKARIERALSGVKA